MTTATRPSIAPFYHRTRRVGTRAMASSIRPVTAPTVVILAAGQGTRMRSRTPKVLHDLCGRPMIAWPVAAALAAGAGKVVVVDGPQRPLDGQLPDGVELAVQPEPNGTGGAVQAAAAQLGDETVLVLNGDVPLVTAEALAALLEAHAADGAQATVASMELDDPDRLRAGRAPRGRLGRARGGDEGRRRRDRGGARDPRGQRRRLRLRRAAALKDALERLTPDNAQGELYLPAALDLLDRVGSAPRSTTRRCCSGSTTASTWPACARSPRPASTRPTSAPASRSSIPPAR